MFPTRERIRELQAFAGVQPEEVSINPWKGNATGEAETRNAQSPRNEECRSQFGCWLRQFIIVVKASDPFIYREAAKHVVIARRDFEKDLRVHLPAIVSNCERQAEYSKNERPQRTVANECVNCHAV